MKNELAPVEFKSLSGIMVTLDAETVKNTLTRGNGNVTDQEVAMFIRTCQAKALDPFENGEVYLIKYDNSAPAQLVVGCHAYVRRADHFPDYRGYKSGITVVRSMANGTPEIVQKEGSCIYKQLGEVLIGGWCRVYRERSAGNVEETFVEVSLEEYSTGKSNWNSKPATMIQKVAKSQAFRAAFPNEYEGLYTIEETQASGAIPAQYRVDEETGEVTPTCIEEDSKITQEERQAMFAAIREVYADSEEANKKLKEIVLAAGFTSTADLPMSAYKNILETINGLKQEKEDEKKTKKSSKKKESEEQEQTEKEV